MSQEANGVSVALSFDRDLQTRGATKTTPWYIPGRDTDSAFTFWGEGYSLRYQGRTREVF